MNASPNNTGLHRAAAGAEGIHLVSVRPVRGVPDSSAPAVAPRWPVRSSTATISRTRRDRFRHYYDGKLFIYEWMRGWIIAVTMDAKGDLVSMERFMPSHKFSNPIDMEFGPNGDLYVLEYGTAWFQGNDDARLVRIEYNAGNRKPIVAAGVDKPLARCRCASRSPRPAPWISTTTRCATSGRILGRDGDRGAEADRSQSDVHLRRGRASTPRRSP